MSKSANKGHSPSKKLLNNDSFDQQLVNYLDEVKNRYESNKSLQEAIKLLKKKLFK